MKCLEKVVSDSCLLYEASCLSEVWGCVRIPQLCGTREFIDHHNIPFRQSVLMLVTVFADCRVQWLKWCI